MKVVLTSSGRFHSFEMARQLERRCALEAIFSGYPLFKLRNEPEVFDKIRTFPYYQTVNMALVRYHTPERMRVFLSWVALEAIDKHVAKRLPPCDAFVALSSVGLYTARVAKERGAAYACDRGSAHIGVQKELVEREYPFYGLSPRGFDPRIVEKELAEYKLADAIFTPSTFAMRTFVEQGIPESRLAYAPYGVDLTNFQPVAEPDPDRFDVLFVGIVHVRKGIRFLLSAFRNIDHPNKHLTLVGRVEDDIRPWIEREIRDLPVTLTGRMPQDALKEHMSRAHVMVLPSVEDGFGMVISQAMACACPVIASDQTGGPDVIDDNVEGFIFKSGDVEALTHYLRLIAKDPGLRTRLSVAARSRVVKAGGWDDYGETVYAHLERMTAHNETGSVNHQASAIRDL